jgi:hypothetical protein
MVEGGDRTALAREALARLLEVLTLLRDDLQCDEPMEPGVLRLEDFTHPARAERMDDDIWTEPVTGIEIHGVSALSL